MMTNIFIRIGNDAKNERMTILWYGTDVQKTGQARRPWTAR
ncbi:hypothetical protein ACR4XJ_07820 [Nitratidesulfovibrio sp. D1]